MAKHEFGIMQTAPQKGTRYDEYEPQKYNCISIDDRYIESLDLNDIDFYRHSLDVFGKGIAYCGVTLIPPESLQRFISVIDGVVGLDKLKQLLKSAADSNRWVIHFGL